jgi:hypothetical protein
MAVTNFAAITVKPVFCMPYGGNKQWQKRKKAQRRKRPQRRKRENSIT